MVEADPNKRRVFKEMILSGIRRFSNLIRAAVIPQTLTKEELGVGEEAADFGDWGEETALSAGERATANWLPTCLRWRLTFWYLLEGKNGPVRVYLV